MSMNHVMIRERCLKHSGRCGERGPSTLDMTDCNLSLFGVLDDFDTRNSAGCDAGANY